MANEVILKNVKLRWAYLDKPQTTGEFASNKYQVDVVLDDVAYHQANTDDDGDDVSIEHFHMFFLLCISDWVCGNLPDR